MAYDTAFWVGLFLLFPAFFVVGNVLTDLLLNRCFDDKLTISVRHRDGTQTSTVIHLSNDDELKELLFQIGSKAGTPRKKKEIEAND